MDLREPDVRHGHGHLDVAHALATDAGDGHFDAATIADDVLVFDALVFSAGALVSHATGPKIVRQKRPPCSGLKVR